MLVEEDRAGVGNAFEAAFGHGENADFVDGTESVFDRTHQGTVSECLGQQANDITLCDTFGELGVTSGLNTDGVMPLPQGTVAVQASGEATAIRVV